jgi:hypothetical protein
VIVVKAQEVGPLHLYCYYAHSFLQQQDVNTRSKGWYGQTHVVCVTDIGHQALPMHTIYHC